jgi:Ca2+-binding EF-hand superfamily protein
MSTARVSRPPSVSFGGSLPDLAHPATSRPATGVDLDSLPGPGIAITDRPLVRSSGEVPFRVSKSAANIPRLGASELKLPPIAQGAPVVSQSGVRPSIPVFGQKTDFTPRAETARSNASVSSSVPDYQSKLKLEVDELEKAVKKKVNDNFYAVRSAFVTADFEGQGSVARDICHRVLMTLMGRTISLKHFNHLLSRAGMGEKSIINYGQFYSAFRNSQNIEAAPQIFETQHKHFAQDKNFLTANQVNSILKEKARKKVLDIANIIPKFQISDDPHDKGRVLKPELFFALQGQGIFMTDQEYDKLWAKFDKQNLGVVDSKVLTTKLGIRFQDDNVIDSDKKPVAKAPKLAHDVERVLKGKLQVTHSRTREAFSKLDKDQSGNLSKEDTLKALRSLDIEVTMDTLKELLIRVEVNPDFELFSYDELLEKVQQFKDVPLHIKFIHNDKVGDKLSQRVTAVEQNLKQLFQPHLQLLLEAFDKADRLNLKRLSIKEFKEVLEDQLLIEITDYELETLKFRLPIDDDDLIDYVKFMDRFSLKNISVDEEEDSGDVDVWEEFENGRPVKELIRQIKLMFRDHFSDVEVFYRENIDWNTDTGRFNKEQFRKLLNTFIVPEVTAGEVRNLWATFHLNQDKSLTYQSFLQHFLYNKKTAAYPSQRICPPQIGDADLIRRSNKVNSSRDIVLNLLNRKIDVFWGQIRNEMKYLDPHETGFVSQLQFKNVLS